MSSLVKLMKLLATGVLCAMLVGCVSDDTAAKASDAQADAEATVTVTDAYGRQVDVPATVETAATVGSAARFVVYVGAQEKLVAVTDMDKESEKRPYTVAWRDLLGALPVTSEGNHLNSTDVDAEALIALAPDVIISSRSAEECDALQAQTGIPVVGISYQGELFADEVYASLEVVGEALGARSAAEELVAQLKQWQADLSARTEPYANDAAAPTVYAGAVNYKGSRGWCGTAAAFAPFDAVGAHNVADATGLGGAFETDFETLLTWDPDIVFLNPASKQLLQQDYAANGSAIEQLSAVKSGELYALPAFNYNGTNLELGVCECYYVGSVLYPQAFADLDLPSLYDEIFEAFLQVDYYDTLCSQGLGFGRLSLDELK